MKKLFTIIILAAVLAAPVAAQDSSPPPKLSAEEIAALKARNQEIVRRSPNTSGVFAVQDDGTIKHLQSGLVCPENYPNAAFFNALVYPSDAGKGADVGCDYSRADDKGRAVLKLTIFAVKPVSETTLDRAFEGYRQEITQTYPNAIPLGPALHIENKGGASQFPEIRSEEYSIAISGLEYTSQLVVAIAQGWVIEIRATFPGKPNAIELNKDADANAAAMAVADRAMVSLALVAAVGTVGK